MEYLESASGGGQPPGGRLPKVDYKEVLKPEEFEVFSRLRDWRKTVAEQEGVPVYVVFTNEQLAEMVRKRVASKAELGGIEGRTRGKERRHSCRPVGAEASRQECRRSGKCACSP